MVRARRAGRALVLGAVALSAGVMPAAAQSLTPAEQLREAIVVVLTSPACLGRNKTALVEGKWTTMTDAYGCMRALRDALAALVLTSEPEPPVGPAAVVTCTYSLAELGPPQCVAAAPGP